MSDFPMKKITIYHKNDKKWDRYVIEASYRNTSMLNRNKNGSNSNENVLIRIFDIKDYNSKWFVEKEDIIVNKEVDDNIESIPLTQLSNKYGKDNVHKVNSINNVFIFDDKDIEELNHIKLGCI